MISTTGLAEVHMPDRPDVPGLRFRHWQGFDDLVGMAAANQRVRDAFGQQEVINVESMTRTYQNLPHCDLSKDLVVVERDGRTIGYVRVDWQDLLNGERQFFSFCVVDPAERGQGIGQAMLHWSEARLGQIAASLPADRPGQMFSYTFEADAPGRALLERNGWHAVARGHDMVRPTLDDIVESPLPEGLIVRAVAESERRLVWDAAREAFRDERDAQEWTEAQWTTFPDDLRDVSLWVIAFDGEEVAGGVWNAIDPEANAHHGYARGALATVWTGARWRRRGLAKALIGRSLLTLRDRGMTSAYLDVDGANPNQAMDLYLSQGFETASSTFDWRKPLPSVAADHVDLPSDLDLTVRPFRDDADYGPLADLMSRANEADGIPWRPTEENMRTEIDGADGADPIADIVLVEGTDGLVAWAMVERVVRDGVPNYDLWGYVRPDQRRRGIGGALFERNLRRVETRVAVEDPEGEVLLRAQAEVHEAGHHALLARHGFATVRQFFLMARDGLADLPAVPLPDGLEIRPVVPADHRVIWEAEGEAFQDHWGAHLPTEHDFHVTFSQSALDTDLWAVAWDGDEVAGVVQAWIWVEENESMGTKRGWLEKISVRRPWRKRGLGRALTAAAMANLRDAGMTEAMLGVDAQNPTGALGLYEGLGFTVSSQSQAWQRTFRESPPA